jgi:hypothetical protein
MARFMHINSGWSLVVDSTGMQPVVNRVLPLPKTFDPAHWHRLNLIQHQCQTQILLDDEVMLYVVYTTSTSQPGIMLEQATIECAHVWQVGLE